ncbi:MAG: HEAT repeat domain-containing protein [Elusimicrobiota bacterium]
MPKSQVLEKIFKIRPEEIGKTALTCLYFAAVSFGLLFTRTAGDTLFLTKFDIGKLPLIYVGAAVLVSLVTYLYMKVGPSFSRLRMITVVTLIMIGSLLLSRAIFATQWHWFYLIFPVWVEVVYAIMLILMWALAGDLFTVRQAKRLFGLVSGGAMIGYMSSGMTVRAFVARLGTENLLYLAVAGLAASLIVARALARTCSAELAESAERLSRAKASSAPAEQGGKSWSGYTLLLGVGMAAGMIVMTIVDYQFKVIAKMTYDGPQLAAYFGTFYVFTNLAAMLMQFFVVSRLLEKLGMLFALSALPCGLLGGSLSILLRPGIWASTCTKFVDSVTCQSIHYPAFQLLYQPMDAQAADKAKAFVSGVARPIAMGLGGLLLLLLSSLLPVSRMSLVSTGLIAVWMGLMLVLRKEYVAALSSSMKRRRLDLVRSGLDLANGETIKLLESRLKSANHEDVVHALEMLSDVPGYDMKAQLSGLVEHPSPRVRRTCLERYGALLAESFKESLSALLRDPEVEVRVAAVKAWASHTDEDVLETLQPLLRADEPRLRAAAVAASVRYGGLDGVIAAAEVLKAMIADGDPRVREAGARVLGELRVGHFSKSLLGLLTDADARVRVEAVKALGQLQNPKLSDVLIGRLRDRAVRAEAAAALVSLGERVLPRLSKRLEDPNETAELRLAIPRVVERMDSQEGVDLLFRQADAGSGALLDRVLGSLACMRSRFPHLRFNALAVKGLVSRELKSCYRTCSILAAMREDHSPGAVGDLLEERMRRHVDRVFTLLALAYDHGTVATIQRNIRSGVTRQLDNALELMDNMLETGVKEALFPLLEKRSVAERAALGREFYSVPAFTRMRGLSELLDSRDPWLVSLALYAAGARGMKELAPRAEGFAEDRDPMVKREAAACLTRLDLRGYGAAAARDSDPKHERSIMLSTVERVVFLKAVDLFSQVPGEDLAKLAAIAAEVEFEAGAPIFKEGDPGDSLYVVVDGEVKVHTAGGKEIATLGKKECIGEMAILDNESRSASATAVDGVLMLKIDQEVFYDILSERTEIAQGVFKVLVGRLRKAVK